MKASQDKSGRDGMTLVELLVVIAVIVILAAMLLPAKTSRGPAYRVRCLSHLHQIGIVCLMYETDNGGRFPLLSPEQQAAKIAPLPDTHAAAYFRKLVRYLGPAPYPTFACPLDSSRPSATNADTFSDLNVSYFLNVDSSFSNNPAQSILAGDRNLTINSTPVSSGMLTITTNLDLNWSKTIHIRGGNEVYADGHAEMDRTNRFLILFVQQLTATNRFIVP